LFQILINNVYGKNLSVNFEIITVSLEQYIMNGIIRGNYKTKFCLLYTKTGFKATQKSFILSQNKNYKNLIKNISFFRNVYKITNYCSFVL